jgi:hypothetical protein
VKKSIGRSKYGARGFRDLWVMKAITGQVLPSLPVRIVRNIRYTSTHLAPFINQGPPPQACNTTQVPKTNSPTSSVVLVQLCDERTTCRS